MVKGEKGMARLAPLSFNENIEIVESEGGG